MSDLALPLTQSKAFERTCRAIKLPVTRFETQDGTCLVQSRKLPLIVQFHLLSRGPTGRTAEGAASLLREVRQSLSGPLVVNAPSEAEKLGGVQIARGAELALVDLADEGTMRARLHQKWRNQLNKAARAPITIIDQPLDATRHKWFLDAEATQQKTRKYRSYPAGFLLAYAHANEEQARLYTALDDGEPVAAMLVLKHGRAATYQAGIATDLGRKSCAHNALLWKVMSDLSRRSFTILDLGRADLNPGLRRFKLGSGARPQQLGGTLLFHSWFAPRPKKVTSKTSQVI